MLIKFKIPKKHRLLVSEMLRAEKPPIDKTQFSRLDMATTQDSYSKRCSSVGLKIY